MISNILKFTIVDHHAVIPELTDGTPPRDILIKKTMESWRKYNGNSGDQTARSLFPMFKVFLGQIYSEISLKLDNELVPVSPSDEDRHLYRGISPWERSSFVSRSSIPGDRDQQRIMTIDRTSESNHVMTPIASIDGYG
jgi:hypothetical protein